MKAKEIPVEIKKAIEGLEVHRLPTSFSSRQAYLLGHKVGMQGEASGGHNSISYLEGYQNGKRQGIKEVVEWINHYINLPELPELRGDNFNKIFQPQWQAKLKTWGVKED